MATTRAQMMATAKRRLEKLDADAAVIEEERQQLLAYLNLPKRAGTKAKVADAVAPKLRVWKPKKRKSSAIRRSVDGPAASLLQVLEEDPSGLRWSVVVDRAVARAKTDAKNPRRTIGNRLLKLRKRDLVAVRDGKYFPLAQ